VSAATEREPVRLDAALRETLEHLGGPQYVVKRIPVCGQARLEALNDLWSLLEDEIIGHAIHTKIQQPALDQADLISLVDAHADWIIAHVNDARREAKRRVKEWVVDGC
jgi:hypothetical protein